MTIHRSFSSVLFIILLGIFPVSLLPAKDILLKSNVSKGRNPTSAISALEKTHKEKVIPVTTGILL